MTVILVERKKSVPYPLSITLKRLDGYYFPIHGEHAEAFRKVVKQPFNK